MTDAKANAILQRGNQGEIPVFALAFALLLVLVLPPSRLSPNRLCHLCRAKAY